MPDEDWELLSSQQLFNNLGTGSNPNLTLTLSANGPAYMNSQATIFSRSASSQDNFREKELVCRIM